MSSNAEDLVGEPAIVERLSGDLEAGQVAHVKHPTDEDTRVQLRTDGGPVDVDPGQVQPEGERVRKLATVVRRECSEPTSDGERSALASYASVIGSAHAKLDATREELDLLLRAAIRCGALVEWTTGDGRWFVPAEEDYLRAVIGEENRRAEPSRELIEHCAAAIEGVGDGGE